MALSRRAVIRSGVILGCAGAVALWPRRGVAMARVPIPERPMRLLRRLERSLIGTERLIVTREWRVEFRDEGDVIAIGGVQIDAQVAAPESLAPLAAIEQSRSTADMWPIMLSSEGMIVAAGADTIQADLAAALREAEKIIAERGAAAAQQAAHRQFLRELERARTTLLDRLPDDLFFPSGKPMRMVRPIELPGGLTGEFEVSYDAIPAIEHGWLSRAERRITTRIGQSEQLAIEQWELSEL
ncbi:hypothetical protein [Qipengyuania sp. ASV99]|uniref:hypothetical protein n=1 Tax=Qipengyuania sp. ASV99 TaxID=3399681 RepID=UPI003A4C61B4